MWYITDMDQELPKQLDIPDIFRKSWEHYKRNWKVLTGILVVIAVVSYIVEGFQEPSPALYSLLSMVIGIATQLVIINASLGAVRGKVQTNQLAAHKERLLPLLAVSILVGLLIGLGFILLVVPGIVLMIALQMAQYVVVDQKRGVIESLYDSADLTRGVRWQLLGILILIVVMNVLGALPFALGLLVTVPLSSVVMAEVYERLTKGSVGRRVAAV